MRTDQGRSRKQNVISVKGAANNPANTSRNNENKSVVSDTNIFSQNIQSHVCAALAPPAHAPSSNNGKI